MADAMPSDDLHAGGDPSDLGSLRPGTRLGRYELLVPIARGGMARVWAARLHGQRGFQKLVAIKTILPHLASQPEFEKMFLDEARIAAGVHHPNVCEIYELGEEPKTLYLVMEWVNGDSVARILRPSGGTGRTEPIDPRVAARIIADASAGVHAAHELTDEDGRQLGVVHRDLSPHNILITGDGTAKVADFGVAKALGQLHEVTSAGQIKGKVAYMAPEQVTGSPIDRRSDVFALGCVLYEATTGTRPFRGEGDHVVMHAVVKGEYEPPSSVVRGYPKELEQIVHRALAQQPMHRFPTAERMRYALEEFLARGQLVTQSNVAQVVRTRIGDIVDRRRERIRQASAMGDLEGGWTEPPSTGATPSNQAHGDHRSGVKQARPLAAGPPYHASQPSMAAVVPPAASVPPHPPHDGAPAPAPGFGSTTIPQVPPVHSTGPFPAGPTPMPPGVATDPSYSGLGPPIAQTGSNIDLRYPSNPGLGPPAAGTGQYLMAVGLGVLLAIVIGAGGFFTLRARRAQEHPPVLVPTGAQGSTASADLGFELAPEGAVLVVDGRELGHDVRSIPRPPAGKTLTVVVRAPGHEEQTILVDYFTAAPVRLSLKPAAQPATASKTGAAATSSSASSGTSRPRWERDDPPRERPRSREPGRDPALPANPY